ncbi:MAG: HlyD family efflux transporter periplasmic adaptor subunit [Bacteroidetes bacterium]|nr:HlyD family efflux transporter periplasmic adaptor subunit [Bacteroidota bacterium]MBI3482867.1 HlyD family efflux transporter periplasmic adaptor subunit [Bacteroidota bacterium]
MDPQQEKELMPSVLLEITSQNYLSQTSKKSILIYLAFCLATSCALVSFFFVSISISKQATALIRPSTEISTVRSLVNGRIKESFIKENQFVKKGDLLCMIESEPLIEKEKFLTVKKQDIENFISDLRQLTSTPKASGITTALYRQAYRSHQQKLAEADTHLSKTKTDYNRNLKLHNERVIADVEFENFKFEFDKAQNELELLKQNQLSQWQNDLRAYERELQDIESQLAQLRKEKENLVIKAPVTGNIQNLAGIYQGSAVFTNQDIAQISPATNLIVEAYINPNDIGFIRSGMSARFQVDAFNYNQWGLASGRVMEISNDVHFINEKPVFKVKCQLDKEYLQLKNGYKGYLKKGMTLQARFMVTERTLWQLLYDKADDWLNPNTFITQN